MFHTLGTSRERSLALSRPLLAVSVLLLALLPVDATASGIAAGGDTVVDVTIGGTDYRIHTFTTTGVQDFVVNEAVTVDVLIVAGGGGGGTRRGGTSPAWAGGGGAGGMLEFSEPLTPGTYQIVVGAGGAGGTAATEYRGGDGGTSSAFGSIASGGGGGAASSSGARTAGAVDGRPGGSGGGGAHDGGKGFGGLGATNQGFDGGDGEQQVLGQCSSGCGGGGGGGAGGPGDAGLNDSGGAGGPGRISLITGTAVTYAGGGGGAKGLNVAGRVDGPGGAGGGGTGSTSGGVDGTGGGGGAGPHAGGSGIVIVRYEIPVPTMPPVEPAGPELPSLTLADTPSPGAARFDLAGGAVDVAATVAGPRVLRFTAGEFSVELTGTSATGVARGLVADPALGIIVEVCADLVRDAVIEVLTGPPVRLTAAHRVSDDACQRFEVPLASPLDGGGPTEIGTQVLRLILPSSGGTTVMDTTMVVGGPVPNGVPAGDAGSVSPSGLIWVALSLGVTVVLVRRRGSFGLERLDMHGRG